MSEKDYRDVRFDETQENSSRDKWRRYCRRDDVDYEFTKGQYDSWDVCVTAYTEDRIIKYTANYELKDRDISWEEYAKWGYMIEQIKAFPLLDAYDDTGSIPVLYIFFRDRIWYCNLNKIDWSTVKWKWRLCTATTAEGTYGEKKVWKLVYDIPIDKGCFIEYE